jgi:tripartite-type tricarboxylate transporter receptor subunit TctC
MNKKIVQALNVPETRQKLINFGIQPVGNTADEYAAQLASETRRWHALIKELGITLD